MINHDIADELYKNIIKYSIDSLCPISRESLSVEVGYRLQFINLNITAKIDKDFRDACLAVIRKATQVVMEDHSLDGVGLSCEIT